ncbi:MAG: hypothetical protein V3W31_01610 [Thermodesulfobacteriota bacterium]
MPTQERVKKRGMKTAWVLVAALALAASGCSGGEGGEGGEGGKDTAGREPLDRYEDIITEADLRERISYTGTIERNVEKSHKMIHFTFGPEGYYLSGDGEWTAIFVAHLEYMTTHEETLLVDMGKNEPLPDQGEYVWYIKPSMTGYHRVLFYAKEKGIIVEVRGRAEGKDHDPSTVIDREGLVLLARIIKDGL